MAAAVSDTPAEVPGPPQRTLAQRAPDMLVWGAVIVLLFVGFKPVDMGHFTKLFTNSESENAEVYRLITEALALEPDNGRMLALAAGAIEHRGAMGWPPFGPDDRERCADFARRAKESVDRGARLTAQLLSFARAQSLLPRVHDVNALVANLRELIEVSVGSKVQVRL